MSETPKVWILFGSTGEYSDHSEWVVAAYTNEADAKADAVALNARAAGIERLPYGERDDAVKERLTAHDADAAVDYTGAHYYVGKCDVFTARRVPDFPEAPAHAH